MALEYQVFSIKHIAQRVRSGVMSQDNKENDDTKRAKFEVAYIQPDVFIEQKEQTTPGFGIPSKEELVPEVGEDSGQEILAQKEKVKEELRKIIKDATGVDVEDVPSFLLPSYWVRRPEDYKRQNAVNAEHSELLRKFEALLQKMRKMSTKEKMDLLFPEGSDHMEASGTGISPLVHILLREQDQPQPSLQTGDLAPDKLVSNSGQPQEACGTSINNVTDISAIRAGLSDQDLRILSVLFDSLNEPSN